MKAPAAVKNLKKKKKEEDIDLKLEKATDANGYEVYQATKAKGKYKRSKPFPKQRQQSLP